MNKLQFTINTLSVQLEGDLQLSGALLFPEWTTLGEHRQQAERSLLRGVERMLEGDPVGQYHRRRLCNDPRVERLEINIAPPKESTNAWRHEALLTFDCICWQHADGTSLAYVPALNIETIADKPDELLQRVEHEIRFALMRERASASLRELVELDRMESIDLSKASVEIEVPTAKQRAIRQWSEEEASKSVLQEVADDLRKETLSPAYERSVDVARLADLLTQRSRASVLLIGDSGVGKTAIVHELVRRADRHDLVSTPFWATSGARLVAGMTGFGMWQERCTKLIKEAGKRKAVLHIGSLFELSEVGKSIANDQGIADFLRPAIARGELVVIAETTPEQLAALSRNEPQLIDVFQHLKIESPTEPQGRAILNRVVEASAADKQLGTIGADGVDMLVRLHRRWATYSAWPGRPLRFLRNLLKDRAGAEIEPKDCIGAFSAETGLPRLLLDDDLPLDQADTREWFARRVLGQDEPVELVVDLLTAVKADVTRAGRPIASLMFIGPTGVGKTEMAKALAEFLYQDPYRMVRFDMSEYSDPQAVQRLIGGTCDTQGLLTRQVRQQPFGVVLLDELEKAHPSFFDLLLQVLGEGRLTDAGGRVADFTNSLVIMTSNLGATTFRHGLGFDNSSQPADAARRSKDHFTKETRDFFRPELFNRLDRIVPFQPLPRDVVRRIVDRRLDELKVRDGVKFRDVQWEVSADVGDRLAEQGYSSRYGARPVARTLERELTIPLAKRLNRYAGESAITIKATAEAERISLDVKVRQAVDNDGQTAGDGLIGTARDVTDLRRLAQRVCRSSSVTAMRNEIYRLEELERRLAKDKKRQGDPTRYEHLSLLSRLQKLVAGIDATHDEITAFENEVLVAFYRLESYAVSDAREKIASYGHELFSAAKSLYLNGFEQTNRITLVILGEDNGRVLALTKAYEKWVRDRQGQISMYQLVPHPKKPHPDAEHPPGREEPTHELLHRGHDPDDDLENQYELDAYRLKLGESIYASPRKGLIGVGMEIVCDLAFPILLSEMGRHVFKVGTSEQSLLVETNDRSLSKYEPPAGVTRRGAFDDEPILRTYIQQEGVIEEKPIGRFPWTGRQIADSLDELLQERFRRLVWRSID